MKLTPPFNLMAAKSFASFGRLEVWSFEVVGMTTLMNAKSILMLCLVPLAIGCGKKSEPKPKPTAFDAMTAQVEMGPVDSLPDAQEKAQCLRAESESELTVISDDAALAAATMLDEGDCAGVEKPTIDFEKHAIVLATAGAACSGTIGVEDAGFYWSEVGDCEIAMVLNAAKVVDKGAASEQALRQIPWTENPKELALRMTKVAEYVSAGNVDEVRRLIGKDKLTIIHNETGEDAKTHRKTVDGKKLSSEILQGTMLASKSISDFSCKPGEGDRFECLASGEGYMNKYTLRALPKGTPDFALLTLEENDH